MDDPNIQAEQMENGCVDEAGNEKCLNPSNHPTDELYQSKVPNGQMLPKTRSNTSSTLSPDSGIQEQCDPLNATFIHSASLHHGPLFCSNGVPSNIMQCTSYPVQSNRTDFEITSFSSASTTEQPAVYSSSNSDIVEKTNRKIEIEGPVSNLSNEESYWKPRVCESNEGIAGKSSKGSVSENRQTCYSNGSSDGMLHNGLDNETEEVRKLCYGISELSPSLELDSHSMTSYHLSHQTPPLPSLPMISENIFSQLLREFMRLKCSRNKKLSDAQKEVQRTEEDLLREDLLKCHTHALQLENENTILKENGRKLQSDLAEKTSRLSEVECQLRSELAEKTSRLSEVERQLQRHMKESSDKLAAFQELKHRMQEQMQILSLKNEDLEKELGQLKRPFPRQS